jgi:hypothetical protein
MIPELLELHNFRGMSREQIVDLLGEPSSSEPAKAGFPQFDIIYDLGIERQGAWSLDSEALGFTFGPDDRVVEFGVSVN